MDGIEAAYVKPPAEPAQFRLNEMAPAAEEPPVVTPDFTARQDYLERAPVGIDAISTPQLAVVAGERTSKSSTSSGVGASIMKTSYRIREV